MSRIEKRDFNTTFKRAEVKEQIKKEPQKVLPPIPAYSDIKMPSRDISIPTPPFWGRRVLKTDVKEIAYEWINHKMLFKRAWGYTNKGKTKEQKQKQRDEELWPLYERVEIYFFDENEGYFSEKEVNKEPLKAIKQRAVKILKLPRQRKKPYRSLSDYLSPNRHDVLALTCVSAGEEFSRYEQELFKNGSYKEYHLIHGISVELAEALAEVIHKQIRLELGIAKNEGHTLRDVKMSAYQGCRYSFGYPACPNLADNRVIFDFLKPEEFGITLSETYHHKEAMYFNVN